MSVSRLGPVLIDYGFQMHRLPACEEVSVSGNAAKAVTMKVKNNPN
jgi:hypothetical protein